MSIAAVGAAICGITLFASSARAEVKPSALFGDHAVLQSGTVVPIWGTADAGERVTVTLEGETRSAVTDAQGKWTVSLVNLKAGGPFEMTIAGKNTIVAKDVLVGEVWLGAGQSNMVFNVSKVHKPYGVLDEEKVIAAANYPQVRMFTVKDRKTYEPQSEVEGEWKVCSPTTVGDFSAVGYFFARDLNRALKVPVGMIITAYGASTAEAWLPREALVADPALKPMVERFDAREEFFKTHPGAMDDAAPGAPQPLNATPKKPAPLRDPVQDQHQPTVLFNGMLNPVISYAIRGAIWYQGESIVGGKTGLAIYPHTMETLVSEWRRRWHEGNFPFYSVQLAALKNTSNNPMVREAQAKILALPRTGLAVTIDIGDPTNVHPKNKEPLGDRLTRIALANTYGRKMEFSGPMYESAKLDGAAIRVRFTHAAGMKSRDGGPLKWFQIAGADEKFFDAEAKIVGDTVVVSNPQVSQPVVVRYAWDNYPDTANLVNAAGLPAAPFRTDHFDALSGVAKEFTGK